MTKVKDPNRWAPTPGPQERFVACGAFEALYGGAAGGGKSEALLMAAARYIHDPSYRALLLRRTYPELKRSLIDRSHAVYGRMGGKYSVNDKTWTFPGRGPNGLGGVIEFGQIESDVKVIKYASAEYQFIGFDELTTFTEHMYVFLTSRLRSTTGIPLYLRAGTNPGGPGHEWVLRRFAPWLYPDGDQRFKGRRAGPEERRFYRFDERLEGEVECERQHEKARARTFFPAKVVDNPYLAGTGYENNLDGLDRLTRQRLKLGNWMARPAGGMFFERGWFGTVEHAPADVVARVRYWDRAASKNKRADFTCGVLLSLTSAGIWTVEDMIRFQGRPHEVEAIIKSTATKDLKNDPSTLLFLEEDPGQAGKFEVEYYARQAELIAAGVRFVRPAGDKITRANPVSAQAEAKNFQVVKATWNHAYFEELEAFPEGHDDQVDATSGALRQALFFGSLFSATGAQVTVINLDEDDQHSLTVQKQRVEALKETLDRFRIADDIERWRLADEAGDEEAMAEAQQALDEQPVPAAQLYRVAEIEVAHDDAQDIIDNAQYWKDGWG